MDLKSIKIKNHPFLKNIDIDLFNKKKNECYRVIAFVGENGCGKTTLLNEIFNYDKSKYTNFEESFEIKNKKQTPRFNSLYLRQGMLYFNTIQELTKLISGEDVYSSTNNFGKNSIGTDLVVGNGINIKDKGINILKRLKDKKISDLFLNSDLKSIDVSSKVAKLIDGMNREIDLTTFSSGQQEIILKLKELNNIDFETDIVLLDEPETSLHPRWQKEIVNIVESLIDNHGNVPQIFIATHSEKVLESLIGREDTLIVRLYKKGSTIKYETLEKMDLVLAKPTFAELDYLIFKIDSFEYCSELYDNLEWITEKGSEYNEKIIINSKHYKEKIHCKEWFNDKAHKITSKSLPIYCRNYFHHPKDRVPPTKKELHNAIELLRHVIIDLKKENKDL